tara:strand:- start:65093 stop:67198 length:2106 start_codon:yes stop_codon:yes gene_type:complete
MYHVGVDVGGTFTDSVAVSSEGRVFVGKSPTTHEQISRGVLASLEDLASKIGGDLTLNELLAQCSYLGNGTTVGTNALVTRNGAKLGLILTAGFEDTPFIQRAIGRLAGLTEKQMQYQVSLRQPKPLVGRKCIAGVIERVDRRGEILQAMDENKARAVVKSLLDQDVEAIAISLLWSFLNPVHEKKLMEIIRELDRSIPISASHELSPKIRENARCNTVMIDAFVGARVHHYLRELQNQLATGGLKKSLATMQCFGGVSFSIPNAISTIDSGPVGGVMASKHLAGVLGEPNVITTDVGGTTFDVSVIWQNNEMIAREFFGAAGVMDRFEVAMPRVDIQSTGAGGGTIARFDPASQSIKLGPDSAGSSPGPVFFGRGGTEPTVADAWMVLGYLDPNRFLGGRFSVDIESATAAIKEKLAGPMGKSVVETALGIVELANNHMSDAIKVFMTARGLDTRDFVLFAFGGGGPMHAAAYGKISGVKRTYMLANSSVASALGIGLADVKRKRDATLLMREPLDMSELRAALEKTRGQIIEDFSTEGLVDVSLAIRHFLDIRYRGQIHELTVELPDTVSLETLDESALKALFVERYSKTYGDGSTNEGTGIEVVGLGVEGVALSAKPSVRHDQKSTADRQSGAQRDACFNINEGYVPTLIYEHSTLASGQSIAGPAFVQSDYSTMLVLPGQQARVDHLGNVIIDHRDE